jgi:hypothetical protein
MLGRLEILRDPARPLIAAPDHTACRDILCSMRRVVTTAFPGTQSTRFGGETDLEVVEKNFHPTISHTQILNSNQALKQNPPLYRDGDYQLNQGIHTH